MENILTKKQCYNPYFLGNTEVKGINIFKDNEIICTFKWLGYGSNNDYPVVHFNEIKLKRKLDLIKKEVFYYNGNLYIHSEICEFKELNEELNYTTATHKNYKTKFSISLNCSKEEPYLNEFEKIEWKLTPVEKREINGFFKYRAEETEECERLTAIQKKLDKITGKYISAEDILRIEQELGVNFNPTLAKI